MSIEICDICRYIYMDVLNPYSIRGHSFTDKNGTRMPNETNIVKETENKQEMHLLLF